MTPFPNFGSKHDHEGLISPERVVQAFRGKVPVPRTAILTYNAHLSRYLRSRDGVELVEGYPGPWRRLFLVGEHVGVAFDFGIGAPAAAVVMEELIALGVKRFLSIGLAGTIQPDCGFGDVLICTSAVRDEGTSHHYLPVSTFSYPSERLTAQLGEAVVARGLPFREGPTWTIDTPYRETMAEARSYRDAGVVTVEMEAAALFAVAQFRKVEVAAGFVVSDSLAEVEWSHAFGAEGVLRRLEELLEAAVACA